MSRQDEQEEAVAPARKLRVAVVGGGKMGAHHVSAIRRLQDLAEIVAVADPLEESRKRLCRIEPTATSYPSIEALLADTKVDVVHVCSPPASHYDLARVALESGAHVYVEKPVAASVAEAESLVTLAESLGLKLCAGHQLLYERPARVASGLMNALGRPVHIESYYSFRPVRRTPDGRTPLRADLQLLDILPHPVYLLLYFLELAVPDQRLELSALEIGRGGTLNALIRAGDVTGTLVVTLEGRPVETYVRLVGRNGTLYADFVRGTVQRLLGPGTSGIDKALQPFRLARQQVFGTTSALGGRIVKRQRSYPGLVELFQAFYEAVATDGPSPISSRNVIETTRIWDEVRDSLGRGSQVPVQEAVSRGGPSVAVTGGTGFLGREVVRQLLSRGASVRVLARRQPAPWQRIEGVTYVESDIAEPLSQDVLAGIDVLVHCAAETIGGWEDHKRNSLAATENIVRAAHASSVASVVFVSSIAVVEARNGARAVNEESPLREKSDASGPYIWGKLESEQLAERLGRELGLDVKIVRPAAIVDYENFDPPGKLGRRIGNIFVAVGRPANTLGVVDLQFAGKAIAWIACRFDEAPDKLHLLTPTPTTKRELVGRLKGFNPDLRVFWLPMPLLVPLSWVLIGIQRILRPNKSAINVGKVFANQHYDSSRIADVAELIEASSSTMDEAQGVTVSVIEGEDGSRE